MAIRSRWGWHPCDYEMFVALKRLNQLYERALRQYAAWQRWQRKAPQNRVHRRCVRDAEGRILGREIVGPRPEPLLPSLFCLRRKVLTYRDEYGRRLREGRLREEVVFEDHGIPQAYRLARRPAPLAETVAPLPLTKEAVRELMEQAAAWDGEG